MLGLDIRDIVLMHISTKYGQVSTN